MSGNHWSIQEIEILVEDYFLMLEADLGGVSYNKAEHLRQLQKSLLGRSNGSIEFKHQNVSAVLISLGLPYISGYKPRANYQRLLFDYISSYVIENQGWFEDFSKSKIVDPVERVGEFVYEWRRIAEEPPEWDPTLDLVGSRKVGRVLSRVDFAIKDANNRRLGRLGEEFVLEVEKVRLQQAGRNDLAQKVEWVSDTRGDGLGYDILSWDEHSGSRRCIEVKTTGLGKYFPFCVTANEVRVSAVDPAAYFLYRVFDFGRVPKMYFINGSLAARCPLEPMLYRVSF